MDNQLTDDGLNPFNEENFTPSLVTKPCRSMPMTLGQYNRLQGWDMPKDQDPETKGYLVKHPTNGLSNHPKFKEYITWVPEDLYESNHHTDGNLTYGDALVLIKSGERLMRAGWNGKNMFVQLQAGSFLTEIVNGVHVDMFLGDHTVLVNLNSKTSSVWVPSPTDHLAEDWSVFPEED